MRPTGPAPVSSRDLTTPTPKLRRPASRRRRSSLALSPLAPIPFGFGLRGRLLGWGFKAIRLIVLTPAQESCHCCCANAATGYAAADVPQKKRNELAPSHGTPPTQLAAIVY